jgi:hypothetical protein
VIGDSLLCGTYRAYADHSGRRVCRSNIGVMGSNPTRGVDICVRLFCVYVTLFIGRGLAMG